LSIERLVRNGPFWRLTEQVFSHWFDQYRWHSLKKFVPETCTDACDQQCAVWLVGCVWKFLLP